MKSLKYILIISLIQIGLFAQNKIYKMTNKQIDSLLTVTASKNMTITERMNYFSELFLGMPYNLTCTGDGPYALYETEPLVNFNETNCMVFCEHVLALSISDSWDNFFNNLQHIRYKDGIIGMRTRNHYTMVDWLPENSWLLHDITKEIGGELAKPLTRTISHKKFFESKGIKDMRYVVPDRTVTINYIPFNELMKVKSKLKTGDIFSLIFKNKDDIFSAHMLMIMEKDKEMVVRESALTPKTTLDTPIDVWIKKFLNSKNYIGVSFMRVNENLNLPGKIILPWNICKLKEK